MNRLALLQKLYHEDSADPFNAFALALELLNTESGRALEMFRALLLNHPDYLPTYYHAAALLAEVGFVQDAVSTYEVGIKVAQTQSDTKTEAELKAALSKLRIEEDLD